MKAKEKLRSHLKARTLELAKLRTAGIKIIGVAPTGYFPEELAISCGAQPVGLIRGGDDGAVMTSTAYIMRWIDTFWRSQISYRVLNNEPLYQMIDLLVVPSTDHNVKAMADCFEFYTDVPVFRYGVPHEKTEIGFKYFLDGLRLVAQRLEELTGNKIDDGSLRKAIELCNKERELLRDISLMRKAERPPISGREFINLNHAASWADKTLMVEVLESLRNELKEEERPTLKGPRVMLTGSTLAMGDYKIIDILEAEGAQVVVEHYSEGLRDYWEVVEPDGDLMKALAECYLMRKVCHGTFRPGKERIDFILRLARDFNVDGIVHYEPMYRDCFDVDAWRLANRLKEELGISMLQINTDYDASEMGTLRTRVEAYVETIKA
ncbi:MAG: 2-hydroxyacyl-CoA dehydratase [Proteobacteria bacterium]|nr:2-hydroxyacyl-CoA dehydratase [Pseudomonadota bacterium]